MIVRTALIVLLCAAPASAQDAVTARVMAAARAAFAPALPFPETDAAGAVPANGSTEALWMVRYPQPGEQTIEVFANPLNAIVQLRATRAMAQIEINIEAAQRRATAQYEGAVAEAKRTGRSQEVDGVTLSDEGVAGERIDADSHVLIEVLFNQREYRFRVPGNNEPARVTAFPHQHAYALMVPAHVYRGQDGSEHFAESQRIVFVGRMTEPKPERKAPDVFEVTAAATSPGTTGLDGVAVRIRGNNELVTEIFAKADWTQLLELLK